MKTQTTAVLFCALLVSTFGHEYLRAHQLTKEGRIAKHHERSNLLSHFNYREAEEVCRWECSEPSNNTGNIQLYINESTNLIGFLNASAEVALIIDINASLVATFNGSSGAAVIFNLTSQSGYYISSGVWVAADGSFGAYFNSLTSLRVVWEIGIRRGVSFSLHSVTEVILREIAGVLIHLSATIAAQLRVTVNAALTILISVSRNLITLLNGVLRGLLNGVGNAIIQLPGGLSRLLNVLEGLGRFFGRIRGGIQVILERSIRLRIDLILSARSGIEILVILLEDLSIHLDLGALLGSAISTVEAILELIADLGGNISVGLDGLWRLVSQIIAVVNGSLSLEVLIHTIINFSVGERIDLDVLSRSVSILINVTTSQEASHNNSAELHVLVKLLTDLQHHCLIVAGINISEIITILGRVGVTAALDLVIGLLVAIRNAISCEHSIPQLILNLLGLLNTTNGTHIVIQIIPNIHITVNAHGEIDIIGTILAQLNIISLIPVLTNTTALLSRIPIIGTIISDISASLTIQSRGSLSLSVLIQSSAAATIVVRIRAWLSSVLHIGSRGSIHTRNQHKSLHHDIERKHEGLTNVVHHHVDEKHGHIHGKHHNVHHERLNVN